MNGCTDREQIADIARTELLAALQEEVMRSAVKGLICEMVSEGILCLPLPEALTFDCETKNLALSLSNGQVLQAQIDCLPKCP